MDVISKDGLLGLILVQVCHIFVCLKQWNHVVLSHVSKVTWKMVLLLLIIFFLFSV